MKTIEWEGRRITLAEDPDDWSVDELDAVEEGLGCDLAGMRGARTTAAMIAVSVHRSDPTYDIAANVSQIKPIGIMRTAIDGNRAARREKRPKVVTRPDIDPLVEEPGSGDHDATSAAAPAVVLSPGNAGTSRARKVPADRKPAAKRAPAKSTTRRPA